MNNQTRRLLEEGVDLSALMEPQMQPTIGPFLGAHLPPSQRLQQQPPSDLDESTTASAAAAAAALTAAGAAEAAPTPAKWWQVWRRWSRNAGGGKQREEDPDAEVVALCSKAMRAVLGRGCTLMIVYYLVRALARRRRRRRLGRRVSSVDEFVPSLARWQHND